MTTPTLLLTLVLSSICPAEPEPASPRGNTAVTEGREEALARELREMAALWRDQASSRNSTTSSSRGGPFRR